jgi:hypothetical protein
VAVATGAKTRGAKTRGTDEAEVFAGVCQLCQRESLRVAVVVK